MKSLKDYTTPDNKKTIVLGIIAAVMIVITIVLTISACRSEDELVKCWIMCKPGSQVNVRRTPSKHSMEVGYLDAGDWFLTDGTSANGWIRCYGIGEYGEGWVYCGYVTTEEPEAVFEQYVCCAPKRVAIRRWMNGPRIERTPWLTNGSNVDVFFIADGWACTSRGYIQAEWLEADPV
jgi:hypothetical protein